MRPLAVEFSAFGPYPASQRLDFGRDGIPPASFALVVAEAFDRSMAVQDWRSLTAPHVDPAVRATLLNIFYISALVLSVRPGLTAAEVRSVVESTCDRIGSGYDASGHSRGFGRGRINAGKAVAAARAAR